MRPLFTVNHIEGQIKSVELLELKNANISANAKIDLTLGGSLQYLKLGGKELISLENKADCKNIYRSSILFPFANRIEHGRYVFKGKTYELNKNEGNGQNAIHGLVFDKAFKLIDQEVSKTSASATLAYEETQPVSGFPFKYGIKLQYILSENAMELIVGVENKDDSAFPFSLGWHPYFSSNDLFNSHLKMHSLKKIVVNDKMIPSGESKIHWEGFHQIKDKSFDDCFVLDNNKLEFKTPEYHLELVSSTENNYLQLYTPSHRKSIAIEPQTAPANSFNTGIGIQILKPDKSYNLSWKINLK